MLGQAQQIATTSPEAQSLEDKAFEQRTAGLRSFRMATPFWRGVVTQLMEKWYATRTPQVEPNVGVYYVASLVGMPPHMGTAGRATGTELIEQLEAQGWAVVLIPEGEKATLIRTKSAANAEKLTMEDPTGTAVVLSEPADGWEDTGTWQYAFFPVGFVAGLVVMSAAMSVLRG